MKEIIVIFIEYLLFYLFFRNSAVGMINEIRTNFKLFAKHYSMPPQWMRKHFNLKKTEIPKFLLFRLYVSMAFGILIPITSIVCLITQFNSYAVGGMMFFPCLFVILDTVVFSILSHIFKRR